MLKRIVLFFATLFIASNFLTAQITTSSLTGTVKDPSTKEVLVGATISAIHTPSGTKFSAVTRAGGQYTIFNMQVGGPYKIEISFVGFVTQSVDDVYLKLAETLTANADLVKTGTVLEQVVVTSQKRNAILSANRTGSVTNVGIREIQRLPSISRNINDFTRLTPQANGASVGGGNYRQNNFTIDGADFNNSFGIGTNLPANGSPISVDALEEISVNVTSFDVRQSGFIGSAINAVTRSGKNKPYISMYHYFRTEKEQGDKVDKVKIVPTPFEYDQWGFSVGGAIVRNKLFYFVNYETENQPKLISTRVAASGSQPFGSASNIARPTETELNNISQYLKNTYQYETGPYQGYSTQIERKKMLMRIDWNINDNHRFNIRYSNVEGGEPNPPSTSRSPLSGYTFGAGRTDINALWFKNSNYFQEANFTSISAELNSKFGIFSNTLRGTSTLQDDVRSTTSTNFPFVDILKDGTPFTSFGYEPFSFGNLRRVKMSSLVDNISWRSGKHDWTVGAQIDLSTTKNGFQRFGASYYTFNSWDDFVNGVKPRDFALTYSLLPDFAQAYPKFEFTQKSFYVQDEISFNNRLKVTVGLRFDKPGFPTDLPEIKKHPLVASLSFANGEQLNTGILPKERTLVSPRIGFNWDLYGDRSLQIRGGTGIFTGKIPFVWIVSQVGDAGMLQVTQTYVGQANTPGPFNPNIGAYRPASVPAAGTVIPSTITIIDPDFKMPQTMKTSLAIDTRLPWDMTFSLEGIYNKDINTAVFRNPNLVNPAPLSVPGYVDNRMIYPIAITQRFINPLTTAGLASPAGTQAFNTIVLDNGDKGMYASLSAKVDKQFSNGIFASFAYIKSFANNLFDGSGDQPLSAFQSTATVNGSNFPVLGYAGFVVPDRLIGTFSYKKEYFKHMATTVSLLYTGSIDGRFSYTYSGDFNRDGTNFDLIYIPKNPSEITFVSNTIGTTTYSAQQQSDMFFAYIDQDKYLRKHKGQYAERNGAQVPWRNQFDIKILQDVFTNIGKHRNTIQVSLDIMNFGNWLNAKWGIQKSINAASILVPTNITSLVPGGTVAPTYRLATFGTAPVTTTFRDNLSIYSTYYMQFGIRYILN